MAVADIPSSRARRVPQRMTATLGRDTRAPVVASVPADHPYIRHLGPEDGGGPVRLTDPDPEDPTRSAQQQWWPPRMLRPDWVEAHGFDLAHVHFGFDSRTPEQLEQFAAALHRRGRPLVFTVHDLRNPHHPDRSTHDAQLDILVREADALITLTPGAAAEIQRRWGREAAVIPHPHVVDLRTMQVAAGARRLRRDAAFRIGLHVKSVRANMDPVAVLPVLSEVVQRLPGAVLQVNVHHELLEPEGRAHDRRVSAAVLTASRDRHVDLRVHDYVADDAAFFDYLGSLDVSVLPYRFGTHSGWLEACRDVGTTVIAPSCGYYSEQGPVVEFVMDEHRFDPDSLAAAVTRTYEERPSFGATVPERRQQRAAIAAAHGELYRSVMEAG